MNNLKELIQKVCPIGVEYRKIKDAVGVNRGRRLTKSQLSGDYEYEVYHGSKDSILGKYNAYNAPKNTTIVVNTGGIGGVKFLEKPFWCSDGSFWLGKSEDINDKYLYYCLSGYEDYFYSQKRIGGVPTIDKNVVEEFKIPVPPIEVQDEIVRILDNFTELTAKLTEELEARKKQYNELAYQLLRKNNTANLIAIKELCTLSKGKTPIQKAEAGEYPMVVTTTERKSCNTYQYDVAAVCIPLVSSRGHGVASLNHVYYQEGKFALGNILCAAVPKDSNLLLAKYLYFYFECTKDYTLVPLMKGGANMAMHIPDIEKVKIPVPDIDTQQSIVSKLEALDEYCNIVLPAEIKARQKQYEYYRDKLLTFEPA